MRATGIELPSGKDVATYRGDTAAAACRLHFTHATTPTTTASTNDVTTATDTATVNDAEFWVTTTNTAAGEDCTPGGRDGAGDSVADGDGERDGDATIEGEGEGDDSHDADAEAGSGEGVRDLDTDGDREAVRVLEVDGSVTLHATRSSPTPVRAHVRHASGPGPWHAEQLLWQGRHARDGCTCTYSSFPQNAHLP